MNTESFLGMLAESPFAGLQEHMSVGDDAVSKLGDFITAATEDDWRTAEECRETIVELENRADDIKNNIRNNLPKSLFMSVSREDLLGLVMTMDEIPNAAALGISSIVMTKPRRSSLETDIKSDLGRLLRMLFFMSSARFSNSTIVSLHSSAVLQSSSVAAVIKSPNFETASSPTLMCSCKPAKGDSANIPRKLSVFI